METTELSKIIDLRDMDPYTLLVSKMKSEKTKGNLFNENVIENICDCAIG